MKKALLVTSLILMTIFAGLNGQSASAETITLSVDTNSEVLAANSYSTKVSAAYPTIPYDPNTVSLGTSTNIYPVLTVDRTNIPSIGMAVTSDPNAVSLQYGSGSNLIYNADATHTLSGSTVAISPAAPQPINIQDSTANTTSAPQTTFYYGPPQLISSHPATSGAISGANYTLSATIADPNGLVGNVRFMVYDASRNVLLDTDSTMNSDGVWVARIAFDSTKYPDGSNYSVEITAEGSGIGYQLTRGYTLSRDSVFFGIDNVKSNEVVTDPYNDGTSIIRKQFVATAYHPYAYNQIPVTATSAQFFYKNAQGTKIPQGAPQAMTRDANPYFDLWSTDSLDSRTLFTNGNGRYLADFTDSYADGANVTTEVSFEVYSSEDVTPPARPQIVSPANGSTMVPGPVTYTWTGNEGDDIVAVQTDRGDIDPATNEYTPRAGGGQPLGNGIFTWTETSDYVPTEAITTYWRLRTQDRAGNWSAWGEVNHFTVDPNYVSDTLPPPKPTLLLPTNNQNVNSSKVVQSWKSEADDIAYYTYESYADPQRKNAVSQEKVTTNSRTTLNHTNGAVWWRVQAVDKSGNKSNWSDLFKMTVSATSSKK